MRNLKTFSEFINENSNEFLFEARKFYKEANNQKLADQYKQKVVDIMTDIADAASKMPTVEYAKDLTEIFGQDAKIWWNKWNPNWDFPNPYFLKGAPKDYKVNTSNVVFIGDKEEAPIFGLDGSGSSGGIYIKNTTDVFTVFVKTDDVQKVFKEWKTLLDRIAKKYEISNQYNTTESSLVCVEKPKIDNRLWWHDENMGMTMEEKKPELGYSYLQLGFSLNLIPTAEESLTFKKKQK